MTALSLSLIGQQRLTFGDWPWTGNDKVNKEYGFAMVAQRKMSDSLTKIN